MRMAGGGGVCVEVHRCPYRRTLTAPLLPQGFQLLRVAFLQHSVSLFPIPCYSLLLLQLLPYLEIYRKSKQKHAACALLSFNFSNQDGAMESRSLPFLASWSF